MYQVMSNGTSCVSATLPSRATPLRTVYSHIVGTLMALKNIYTVEGPSALWRGMGPTIVGVMPSRAIYFSTYSTSKQLFVNLNEGGENSLIHLSAALTAGVVTSTATNPIWLIKTRMQLQSDQAASMVKPAYLNSLHCLKVVCRTEGVRGLYKGLTASYLGSLEGTIQWVLYEKLKKIVSQHRQQQSRSTPVLSSSSMTWLDFFLTAASAKLVAAIVAYPHEVLRTRLRENNEKYRGLLQTAVRIAREEGLAAYYGGMTAHLMRVVPNSAIMFFCYEFLVHGYSRLAL